MLKDKAEPIGIGNTLDEEVCLGTVINDAAIDTFEQAAAEARKNCNVVTGGERITDGDLGRGNFVQPTVVEVPLDSWIWQKELFVPFVSVAPFEELEEAIELSN